MFTEFDEHANKIISCGNNVLVISVELLKNVKAIFIIYWTIINIS